MKSFTFYIITICALSSSTYAQNKFLHIQSKSKEPISDVYIHLQSKTLGKTNDSGYFTLPYLPLPTSIKLQKLGFKSLTFTIDTENDTIQITLERLQSLKEIEIVSKKSNTLNSKINTETIDRCELGKLACCNLAESFENSNTVDVVYSDGITGNREIQMLGLAGVYSQQLMEGTPYHRGILSKVGLELVPGPWIDAISINKGIGSVANGFENISGQINIEFKKPKRTESWFLNGYISEIAKTDLNLIKSIKLNDNLFTNIFGHTSFSRTKMDNNRDGFIDMPLFTNFNLMNKWQYFADNGMVINASIQGASYQIEAGQLFSMIPNQVVNNPYLISQNNKELQAMLKIGWELDAVKESSFAIIFRSNWSHIDGNYGAKNLLNKEIFTTISPIYQSKLNDNSPFHYKVGYNLFYDQIDESLSLLHFNKKELVNGAFGELNYSNDNFQAIIGMRIDHHNTLGVFYSPRASATFTPTKNHTLKLSSGLGFRTPSILTEASGYLISQRTVSLPSELKAEQAINSGISYRINFPLGSGIKSTFEASYFLTIFRNQLLYNLENEGQLQINYSSNSSRAQNIQFENKIDFNKNISWKISYKNDLNAAFYDTIQKSMPLIKTDKFLSNIYITSNNQKWHFSNTLLVNGPARIPNLSMPQYSPWYPIVHAQLNFVPNKNMDFYMGAENIFSYTQQNRIINYLDPQNSKFDAGMIWGPLDKRRIYIGFKYSIP